MVTLMLLIGSTWNLVIILKCASRWPQTQLCTPVLQHKLLLFFKLIHQASAAMNLMLTPCPALPPSLIPEVVHLLCVFLNALLNLAYPSPLSLLHPSFLFPLLFPSSLPTYLLPSLYPPPPPPLPPLRFVNLGRNWLIDTFVSLVTVTSPITVLTFMDSR